MIKQIWNAVLKAEQVLANPETDAGVRASLKQILDTMCWHKGQLAREIFVVCSQGNWDFRDEEIRLLSFYMFGCPANTKHWLEDTFGHLADVVKRIARNLKMSKKLASNLCNCNS